MADPEFNGDAELRPKRARCAHWRQGLPGCQGILPLIRQNLRTGEALQQTPQRGVRHRRTWLKSLGPHPRKPPDLPQRSLLATIQACLDEAPAPPVKGHGKECERSALDVGPKVSVSYE